MKFLFLLGACALLSSCALEPSNSDQPFVLANEISDFASFTGRLTFATPELEGKSVEEQRSIIRASSFAAASRYHSTFDKLEAAASLSEKDRIAKEAIAATPQEGKFLMEQFVAQYMLEQLLSSDQNDLQMIAHHIEALHHNESQRADLIAGGLERLRTIWLEAKVKQYAAEGASRAQSWLDSVSRAATSSSKFSPEAPPPQTTNVDLVAGHLYALEALAN